MTLTRSRGKAKGEKESSAPSRATRPEVEAVGGGDFLVEPSGLSGCLAVVCHAGRSVSAAAIAAALLSLQTHRPSVLLSPFLSHAQLPFPSPSSLSWNGLFTILLFYSSLYSPSGAAHGALKLTPSSSASPRFVHDARAHSSRPLCRLGGRGPGRHLCWSSPPQIQ